MKRISLRRGAALVAGAGALAAVPFPGSAAAAPVATFAVPVVQDITVQRAVRRDCAASPLTGRSGVWTQRFIAPTEGAVTLRLRGGARDDFDLAVFDGRSGERVAGSAGFAATEVVQATMRQGAELLVQVCRRRGAGRTATLERRFAALDLGSLRLGEAPALVRVTVPGRDGVERLERLGFDVTHEVARGRADVVVHSAAERERLAAAGFGSRTLISDLRAHWRAERAKERRYARARAAQDGTGGSPLPTGRTEYRVYEDYGRELKALAEAHRGLVRPVPIQTRTFQGRELQAIEIAQDVDRPDDGRPVFLLNGMHHAREWPSPEGIMEFAHDLVAGAGGKDARITRLLRDVRIVVMPITNADGFIVSRNSPDVDPDASNVGILYQTATGVVLLGGSLSYKRKNCNPIGVTVDFPELLPCEFAIGVDPNRNYAESWGGPGASSNPFDQSYRGSGPFSEPEPRAFRELFSRLNATMMITTHNVAALILRPPGLEEDGFAPDEPQLKELGDAMGAATGYTSQYGWQLYDTTGTTDDWSYAVSGGFGYTIEMGPEDGVFHGNYKAHVIDQYIGTGERAGKGLREAYLLAAEAARNPAWTSRVAGRAPAGRTLRLTKTFTTETSEVCAVAEPLPIGLAAEDPTSCIAPGAVQQVPERFEMTTTVPASGTFEWWVNPSTRPFVAKAGGREVWKLTCERDGKVEQSTDVFVARGETAQLELPCGGVLPPVATGKPSTGVRVSFGRVHPARTRVRVPVRIRGGSLRSVRLRILDRRGRHVLGEVRTARLTKSRTLVVKLRKGRRLLPGTYRLQLVARQPKGSPVRVTRTVRVRR